MEVALCRVPRKRNYDNPRKNVLTTVRERPKVCTAHLEENGVIRLVAVDCKFIVGELKENDYDPNAKVVKAVLFAEFEEHTSIREHASGWLDETWMACYPWDVEGGGWVTIEATVTLGDPTPPRWTVRFSGTSGSYGRFDEETIRQLDISSFADELIIE